MNCHDARELLAAFQDGALAPGESKAIDTHLAVCPACAAELNDLVKAIQLVRDLPEVEPPPFFAKKIMAQVRAEAGVPQGLLRRLFFPLHVKIPIQALTAVFVAVLSVYVYKSMGPESLKPARLEPTGEAVQAPAGSAPAEEKRDAAKQEGAAATVDARRAQAEKRMPAKGAGPDEESGEQAKYKDKLQVFEKPNKSEKSGRVAKADRDDRGAVFESKNAKESAPPQVVYAPEKREAPADRSVAEAGPPPLGGKKAKLGTMKPAPVGAASEPAQGQGAASGGAKAEAQEKKMPEQMAEKMPLEKADKAARDEESVSYAPRPDSGKTMEFQDSPGRMNEEVQFASPPPKKAAAEPTERALAGAKGAPEIEYYKAKKAAKPSSMKFQAAPAEHAPNATAPAAPAAPAAMDTTVGTETAGGEARKAAEKGAAPRSMTVKVKDAVTAADAITSAVSSLGGRVKEKQIRSGKEIYMVEIDAARYPALLEKLNVIGALTRSSTAPASDEGTIEVRVEVVR